MYKNIDQIFMCSRDAVALEGYLVGIMLISGEGNG
jgi:hypothetical protein